MVRVGCGRLKNVVDKDIMGDDYKIGKGMYNVLKRVYGLPASVTVITQVHGWKLGKTDYALALSQVLLKLKIMDKIGTNINTDGYYPLIEDFDNYDAWAHTGGNKLFLFDEAIESTINRRAMSSLNIKWVRRIPQLSKARAHLVVITQSPKLTESAFFNWTFLRGIWVKLSKTTVRFDNPHMFDEEQIFTKVPRTTVPFDPYEFATFREHGIVTSQAKQELTDDDKLVRDFKNGARPYHLARMYKLDPSTVLTRIREALP
jgi:hypothetical protein